MLHSYSEVWKVRNLVAKNQDADCVQQVLSNAA